MGREGGARVSLERGAGQRVPGVGVVASGLVDSCVSLRGPPNTFSCLCFPGTTQDLG